MCGIIGIVAKINIVEDLLSGLKRLEYRGYDSAGIAIIENNKIKKCRASGKIHFLEQELAKEPLNGNIAIGHTRWATHGAANKENAHPHSTNKVAVVHNGIIENYLELRKELTEQNIKFTSDTDSEVIPALITLFLNQNCDIETSFKKTLEKLHGAYAIAAIFADDQEKILIARNGSPLAIAYGIDANYIGSDAYSLAPLSTKISYLNDGDWAIVKNNNIIIKNQENIIVNREIKESNITSDAISKGHYKHYMLKEIYEQPVVIGETLSFYLNSITKDIILPKNNLNFQKIKKIHIVACGTSFYAGIVAKYWFEKYANIEACVEIASEFRYRSPVLREDGVCLFISQSGETIDTLNALRYAKEYKQYTISIVNSEESSMARESNLVLRTLAGPEIGVASTKAFTTQLVTIASLVLKFAKENNSIEKKEYERIIESLYELPALIAELFHHDENIKKIANDISSADSIIYIGRGLSYPIAMEGALKLKELSYIHAEGIAAGELKHGPIALIDEYVPVVVLAPNDELFEKTASNVQEIIARDGKIIFFSDKEGIKKLDNDELKMIELPKIHTFATPILYAVPVQMLAYHVAVKKGTDVDQPRNLAKSVTVE